MSTVTVNGNTYSDDGSTAKDMTDGGHRTWLLPMVQDGVTDLLAKQTACAASSTAAASSATAAATSVTNSSSSATTAASSATAAATSATNASNFAAALIATSSSSLLIAVASKTFTIASGKQFAAGQFVLAVSAADPTNYMHGQVTSYSSTTLIVNVLDIGGSGTYADWAISISGSRGAVGATGTTAATTRQTLTDAATINWDWNSGRIAVVTLGGNRTVAAPTNLVTDTCILEVIQDGTGSRTITWNAIFIFAEGVSPVLSTVAGRHDYFTGFYNGTNIVLSYLRGAR